MKMSNQDQLKMHSPNLVDSNIEKISALFPNCITETKDENGELKKAIDFELLKQELSQVLVEGEQERYRLDWVGKKEAILTANAPIAKTLRPCREESVNFDTTENLFIEGDNLEALKLLQENYLGKVKMIYIDPPYNTGNDFIYEDDFAESTDAFFEKSNQVDEEGNRLIANTDSNGRFHSDWLSMMYSRLKLARNLLKDDGIVFISIDDNEQENLKKICVEIFGSKNFVSQFIWQKKTGAADSVHVSTITEYILAFSKDINKLVVNKNTEAHDDKRYRFKDEYFAERGPYYLDNLDRGTLGYIESLDYGVETTDGDFAFPNGRKSQLNDGWRWKWGKEKLNWGLKNGYIELRKSEDKDCGWGVYYKIYLNVDNEGNKITRSSPYKNLIQGVLNTHASSEAKAIFGRSGIFSNPKPLNLITYLLKIGTQQDDIVLDFFSGSATTANAVMQVNSEDSGTRKFIMVQLPEMTDTKSDAYKEGYNTIAEISKERIRRAGKKIVEDNADKEGIENLDVGFRVLKIDSTNMKDVYYTPDAYTQADILDLADHIKEDRTSEDLLFQVMLDWGLELSLPIERKNIQGKEVFYVAGNSLVACFDDLTFDVVDEVAKDHPLRFVSAEKAIHLDHDKTNIKERFKQLSPDTEVKFL